MLKNWHRLPREVAGASSLETLKVGLDGALSNLSSVEVLACCREVGLDGF